MFELISTEKYSVEKIAKTLKFSTMLEKGIRENFGDPISINELKQIHRGKFLACRNFGIKRFKVSHMFSYKVNMIVLYHYL